MDVEPWMANLKIMQEIFILTHPVQIEILQHGIAFSSRVSPNKFPLHNDPVSMPENPRALLSCLLNVFWPYIKVIGFRIWYSAAVVIVSLLISETQWQQHIILDYFKVHTIYMRSVHYPGEIYDQLREI